MKIFIVPNIDENVEEKLKDIITNQHFVLIGVCWGINTDVQKFLDKNNYKNVIVYASWDKVRNNLGKFEICKVNTEDVKGFEFYRKRCCNGKRFGFWLYDMEWCEQRNNKQYYL